MEVSGPGTAIYFGAFFVSKITFLAIFGLFNFFKFNIARITIILAFFKSLGKTTLFEKYISIIFHLGVRRGRKTLKCESR